MNLTRSALVTGTAALAGYPQCWADLKASDGLGCHSWGSGRHRPCIDKATARAALLESRHQHPLVPAALVTDRLPVLPFRLALAFPDGPSPRLCRTSGSAPDRLRPEPDGGLAAARPDGCGPNRGRPARTDGRVNVTVGQDPSRLPLSSAWPLRLSAIACPWSCARAQRGRLPRSRIWRLPNNWMHLTKPRPSMGFAGDPGVRRAHGTREWIE
jgi:hypothetical protein